ncbi:MAG: hypothetical protein P8M15_04295 [Alphaproteobacteria bacterium]|nr:hypothetical protein [Alphaproteobacteria bacterium]
MRLISKLTIISILSIPLIIFFSTNSEADSKRNSYKTAKSLFVMQKIFDTNKDGNITKSEMTSKAIKAINTFDNNKDSVLSLGEFKELWMQRMNRRMVRHFQRLDQDGNAKVSLKEINNGMDRIMWKMDKNNDNIISKDDLRLIRMKNIRSRINNFSNRPG